MKILVIGSRGMLGSDLIKELTKSEKSVIGWDKEEVDITKEWDMKKVENEKIDVLINCAAYTDVEGAESKREECYNVNVNGVRNLVNVCKRKGVVLVQISTDYVFDGNKEGYDEDDIRSPINYYGKTKMEGEDIIIEKLEKYYIIRTEWLYGKNGRNFVDIIIKLCKEKDEIRVVKDQIGSPTYTKDFSKGIVNIIRNMDKYRYGIYHLTNSGKCSWFEFAKEIKKIKGLNCEVKPCKSKDFPRKAKRPKFSVLNNNKVEGLRDWKEALRDYLH